MLQRVMVVPSEFPDTPQFLPLQILSPLTLKGDTQWKPQIQFQAAHVPLPLLRLSEASLLKAKPASDLHYYVQMTLSNTTNSLKENLLMHRRLLFVSSYYTSVPLLSHIPTYPQLPVRCTDPSHYNAITLPNDFKSSPSGHSNSLTTPLTTPILIVLLPNAPF